jgi:hypothetical protein
MVQVLPVAAVAPAEEEAPAAPDEEDAPAAPELLGDDDPHALMASRPVVIALR